MKYSLIIVWTSSLLLLTNAVPLPKSSEDGPAVQDYSNEGGLIGENEDFKLLSNEDSEESVAEESLNADNSGDNIDDTLDINEDKALDENDSNENLEEDRTKENNGDDEVEDPSKENMIESTANDDDSVGGESEPAVNIDEPADNEIVQNGSQDSKEESSLFENETIKAKHGTEKRGTNLNVFDVADDDLVENNNFVGNTDNNKNNDGDDKYKSDIKIESVGELEIDDNLESDDEVESDEDNSNASLMSVEDKETYHSEEYDDDGEYVTEIVEFTEIVGGDIVEGNSGEVNVIKEGNIAYDHIGGDTFASGKNLISYGASSADIDADRKSKLVGTEVIIEETKLDDKAGKKSKSGHHSNGNSSKRKNEMNTKSRHYSATINSNEDSSEHKDKINNKSGHHSTSTYRNKDSSEQKDDINTKSEHHISSTHKNVDSSESKYKINTNTGHHTSTRNNGDSRENKDEINARWGHHSSSTKSNEDNSELAHDEHDSYEEHRSSVSTIKNKNNKKSNDKYKTMKDSYQYSITKDFEFEGSSEPKALRQSLLIKTGGFPYKDLPNYIKQDLLKRMPPQTDLQQVNKPFGIRERPSIDSINNALEQILTVKSGSLPKPGAWCCPNSMALKGFTCHNGDNKIPAEYFSHLTYFKFKDLMCQTGRPPAEVLGLMSEPMHQMMPLPEQINGDTPASIQGVVPGTPLTAVSGSLPGVVLGDSPFDSPLLIQGGNHGQTNQGLAMDIQSWPEKYDLKSGILATGQLFGSPSLLPGSKSPLENAESHSGFGGLTFGTKDSVYNNFSPDLEIQREIFEDELIPWPGDSENNFDKIIDMMESRNEIPIARNYKNHPLMMMPSLTNNFSSISQAGAIPSVNNFLLSTSNSEVMKVGDKKISSSSQDTMTKKFNELISQGILSPAYDSKSGLMSPGASSLVNNFPREFESPSINQPLQMIPEDALSLNWPLTDNNFADRLFPKGGEKESLISQQTNTIEEELLNWGFPKSNSHFVGRLPPKDGKEVSLIHQQSNPIQEELPYWGFLMSGNQFAGRLPSKDYKESSLIPQQSNPIQEELSSWVFPNIDNHFLGRLPSKYAKEESLIQQQSNPKHDELLSWSFPETDNHFAGRLSPKDGKDKWVENNFDSQNLLDYENRDWIDEGLEAKDYAWVPNDYNLVNANLDQKPFDYTLQNKVLLKAPEGLHLDMLSNPVIGNDYLLQDPNKNIITKNNDF